MKFRFIYIFLNLSLFIQFSFSQNVGIGTTNPTEKLQVEGIVHSKNGGIKFPDNTVQTTAAFNTETLSAADKREFVIMELLCNGSNINGPFNEVPGFNDAFKVFELDLNIERGLDPSTGSLGQILRQPISVIKDIDEGTPEIALAINNNQSCDVTLNLFYINEEQSLENYFKYTLTRARVIQSQNVVVYQGNNQFAHMEMIKFWPLNIIIEHVPSNTETIISYTPSN